MLTLEKWMISETLISEALAEKKLMYIFTKNVIEKICLTVTDIDKINVANTGII